MPSCGRAEDASPASEAPRKRITHWWHPDDEFKEARRILSPRRMCFRRPALRMKLHARALGFRRQRGGTVGLSCVVNLSTGLSALRVEVHRSSVQALIRTLAAMSPSAPSFFLLRPALRGKCTQQSFLFEHDVVDIRLRWWLRDCTLLQRQHTTLQLRALAHALIVRTTDNSGATGHITRLNRLDGSSTSPTGRPHVGPSRTRNCFGGRDRQMHSIVRARQSG